MSVESAGLLVYRTATGEGARREAGASADLEVLLAHMGGPFWVRRERAWSLPKGVVEPGESPHDAALREFAEELGFAPPTPVRPDEPLGSVRQAGGKTVHAWAREGAVDAVRLGSDESAGTGPGTAPGTGSGTPVSGATATVVWPPRSGRTIEVPEVDRIAWVPLGRAHELVVAAQTAFLERLAAAR